MKEHIGNYIHFKGSPPGKLDIGMEYIVDLSMVSALGKQPCGDTELHFNGEWIKVSADKYTFEEIESAWYRSKMDY